MISHLIPPKTDEVLIAQSMLLNAKLAIETPEGIFLNLEIDRFLTSARRYKANGLLLLYKALDEKFKATKPQMLETLSQPQKSIQVTAKFTCPKCNRNFSSQSALSGHRPQKCNGNGK